MLEVVERVTGGKSLEDDRVELKSNWPFDFRRTARQMAGHANQAGGDDVLWLVGIDEKSRSVVPVAPTEMADWWAKVERCFDELSPDLTYLAVPVQGEVVHALVLDTSRAPYLVKATGAGVEREVPWRTANGTRSARRSELLRSLVEEAQVPRLECFGGTVEFYQPTDNQGGVRKPDEVHLAIHLDLYFEVVGACTLPQHRWTALLDVGDLTITCSEGLQLDGPSRVVPGATSSLLGFSAPRESIGAVAYVPGSGLQVSGSDAVRLDAKATVCADELDLVLGSRQKVTMRLRLPLANSSRSAFVEAALRRQTLRTPNQYDNRMWRANFAFPRAP